MRRGLLAPQTGRKGGSNPYQIFSERDVQEARLIRLAQSLGFTLSDIAGLAAEFRSQGLSRKRRIAILAERLSALEQKAEELGRMTAYLRAKIGWMEAGGRGPEPRFDADAPTFDAIGTRSPSPVDGGGSARPRHLRQSSPAKRGRGTA